MKFTFKFEQVSYTNILGLQYYSACNVYVYPFTGEGTKVEGADLRLIFEVKSKFQRKVSFGKGVRFIDGGKHSGGGSNSYPYPLFVKRYCIVEIEAKTKPEFGDFYNNKWIITELNNPKQ